MNKRKKHHLIRQIRTIILIFLLSTVFVSCDKFKDDFDPDKVVVPDWNPEFAIPLINSTFTITDFFGDSNVYIKTNPDHSLSFIYGVDDLSSPTAEEVMNIPDQNFNFMQQYDVPSLPPGVLDTLNLDFEFPFLTDTTGQRLDSIFLKSGELYIHGTTNLNRDTVSLRVTVANMIDKETGAPLLFEFPLNNPDQQEWVEFEQQIDMTKYYMAFNNIGTTADNTFVFLIEIVIHGDENPDLSPYDLNIDGYIKNIGFERFFGYMGQYDFTMNDSLDINLFDKTISGGIQVGPGAISLSMDIGNSLGLPVMIAANELYVTSESTPPYHVDINLFGAGVPNIFTINAPDISHIGESAETNLNFVNTNLDEAFNISPNKLYFDLIAVSNPQGDTTVENFVLDTSLITLDMNLEVKLFASISDFVVEDTVDFDLDQNVDEINNLLIRLNTINRFPLAASIQVYFTDADYQVLDSLIVQQDNMIVEGAPIGGPPEYRVTDSTWKMTDFNLPKQKIQNILTAEKLLLRASLSTTDGQLCIIYDDYSITIKIGTIVGVNITSN
jgi:hypothetical protein